MSYTINLWLFILLSHSPWSHVTIKTIRFILGHTITLPLLEKMSHRNCPPDEDGGLESSTHYNVNTHYSWLQHPAGENVLSLIFMLLLFLCDCRCWSGYSREGSGSQVHVAVEWTLHSSVNTFYGERAEAAGTPPPSSELNRKSWTELTEVTFFFCTHATDSQTANRFSSAWTKTTNWADMNTQNIWHRSENKLHTVGDWDVSLLRRLADSCLIHVRQ